MKQTSIDISITFVTCSQIRSETTLSFPFFLHLGEQSSVVLAQMRCVSRKWFPTFACNVAPRISKEVWLSVVEYQIGRVQDKTNHIYIDLKRCQNSFFAKEGWWVDTKKAFLHLKLINACLHAWRAQITSRKEVYVHIRIQACPNGPVRTKEFRYIFMKLVQVRDLLQYVSAPWHCNRVFSFCILVVAVYGFFIIALEVKIRLQYNRHLYLPFRQGKSWCMNSSVWTCWANSGRKCVHFFRTETSQTHWKELTASKTSGYFNFGDDSIYVNFYCLGGTKDLKTACKQQINSK